MINITENSADGNKNICYKGKLIKSFSAYDDYAFTKGSAYAKMLRKLSEKEFFELYPELTL